MSAREGRFKGKEYDCKCCQCKHTWTTRVKLEACPECGTKYNVIRVKSLTPKL